ncbi:MAG: vesicular-fusion protein S17 [Trizodia sp. TS-e1964]|nr:MAG: vesicular-fusion protein S17 [Trizodia sp. TS-e1964]
MAQDPRALLQKVRPKKSPFETPPNTPLVLEVKANYLINQADKAAASAGGGFSLFGGKQDKYEAAVEAYTQAANAFRLQKQGKEAGMAFERAAAIQTKNLNEPDDAANSLVEAYKSYRKSDPGDAARVLTSAISQYTLKGNFRRAATHQQYLAELYETDIGDQKRAVEAYETAAGWFEGDNAEALANKLYLKVADIAALDEDYYKAIEHFERVAASSINSNLMKWSVKDYLLKAGLCHLATGVRNPSYTPIILSLTYLYLLKDMVALQKALEKYRDIDNSFASTREHLLLTDLSEAVEASDQEAFADKLFEFDRMSKLDKWKTTILLRVKNGIEEKGEDFS